MRRHRNKILLLLVVEFLAFLPFVGLTAIIEKKLFSSSYTFLPAVIAYGALFIMTLNRLRTFPCPRCGKKFFGRFGGPQEFLDRKCAYCGLRRGS
jgi:DNA-directed RNA polymerase subunit RPC12/RpoP